MASHFTKYYSPIPLSGPSELEQGFVNLSIFVFMGVSLKHELLKQQELYKKLGFLGLHMTY